MSSKKSTMNKSGMMKMSSSTKGKSMNVFQHPSSTPAPHPTDASPFYYPRMSMMGSKMGMMGSYKGYAGAGAYSSMKSSKMSMKSMGKSSMSGKGMSYSKSMGMSKMSKKSSMMGKGSSIRMMGGKGP